MRMRRTALVVTLVLAAGFLASAAERHWQIGKWIDVGVERRLLDFGPGASGFGPPTAPSMRAMGDVRTYVIETDDLRLELKDVVPIGRRSVEVTVGQPVTFALEKNSVYVRDPDGTEHRLRLVRKIAKKKQE